MTRMDEMTGYRREWVLALGHGLFEGASEAFLREASSFLQPVVAFPGDVILTQGALGDCMYFLTDGSVEVLRDGQQICVLKRGDLFGEMALIFGERRNASVRALEHSGLQRLGIVDFDRLRTRFPEFNTHLKRLVDRRAATLPKGAKVPAKH